jgi:hypothetical protein
MPRLARLDAPGVLHHIIIRGIERRKVFRDARDRENFLGRLGRLLLEKKRRAMLGRFLGIMPTSYCVPVKFQFQP